MNRSAEVKMVETEVLPIRLDLISVAKLRDEKDREDALLSLLLRGVNNLEACSFDNGCKQPAKKGAAK